MLELGVTSIMLFFVMFGICLAFVIAWILKSESRINACKAEIKKLAEKAASSERENFMLSEELEQLRAGSDIALEKENEQLKIELDEAKSSLEEIYKVALETNK